MFSVSVSVIMATYNTDIPMLKEAVDSILNQTFRDFEFIIIDDGSTNSSDQYLKSLTDERVKIIWNPQNMGVTKSLNVGLKAAQGKYIARMDADDVSLPTRFEKEFAYMEAHPNVVVCGTVAGKLVEGKGVLPSSPNLPKDMEEYRVRMLFSSPGPSHPSAFFRHETLLAHGILYDEKLIYAQDYGMWETISHYGEIYTLNEMLLYRRQHENQISKAKRAIQIQCDKMTQKKILTDLLGSVTDAELDLHYTYSTGFFPNAIITPEVVTWYDRLIQANKTRKIYDQKKLETRVLTIKKYLIRQAYRQGLPIGKIVSMAFRFLPFFSAVKLLIPRPSGGNSIWNK